MLCNSDEQTSECRYIFNNNKNKTVFKLEATITATTATNGAQAQAAGVQWTTDTCMCFEL